MKYLRKFTILFEFNQMLIKNFIPFFVLTVWFSKYCGVVYSHQNVKFAY